MTKSRRPSRRRPPLIPLRAFAVSAKHLSFTLTAKEMCLSQDSVSRAVCSLENYFGFPRFLRGVGS
ncbi:helix-turn-helix domain-containing protein [Rhizobium sp. C4]|uniref:helix-turn-helix domain-containing protein n=1 Tax=Rhizobium sp. C4 TaxID=1349800 RepID=UPI003FA7B24E